MFSNLTLFRFPAAAIASIDQLEDALSLHPLRELGPVDLSTRGFVSPFGPEGRAMLHVVGDSVLLALGAEDKILPPAVIDKQVRAKVRAIENNEARLVGARERRRLKDEVTLDLLPRAFSKQSTCRAYLDRRRGWAVVDSSSRKAAEALVGGVREALGSFPAIPATAGTSVRAALTAWVAGEDLPDGFTLGEECELRDSIEDGGVVKCRRQDLRAQEIQEHLRGGKQVFSLGLVFEERLAFVLGEDLTVRKLKLLEVDDSASEGDAAADLDARFAHASGEIGRLLDRLEQVFLIGSADVDAAAPAAVTKVPGTRVPPPEAFVLEPTSPSPELDRARIIVRAVQGDLALQRNAVAASLGLSAARAVELVKQVIRDDAAYRAVGRPSLDAQQGEVTTPAPISVTQLSESQPSRAFVRGPSRTAARGRRCAAR